MIDRTSPFALLAAAIVVAPLLSTPRHAVAAGPTFTVSSMLDQIDDDVATPGTCHKAANTCTLRAAIMEANRSDVGATIILPAGFYLLTIQPSLDDSETNGDLNLSIPASGNPVITIVGAGAESTIIDADRIDRVFAVAANRSASISGVTISNGDVAGVGGGIFNAGTLTLSNVTISDNRAAAGGGIYDDHILNVIDSRIGPRITDFFITAGNAAFNDGGGIYSFGNPIVRNSTIDGNLAGVCGGGLYIALGLTMRNSTISRNEGNYGGGICSGSNSENLFVVNSTISQNDANENGGGFYNAGTANVYNTTIASNGADADGDSIGVGGGVFNESVGGTFNLRNTLVAGNFTSEPSLFAFFDDCSGALTGFGENLFRAALVSSNCTLNGSWSLLNSLNTLGPLQDNGGPTWTHALFEGSNAIDGASGSGCVDNNSVPLTTDQRGAPRVSGVRCDIGAFEVPEPRSLAAAAVAIAILVAMRSTPSHRV